MNKKGFTLVEMVLTIIILAIVVLSLTKIQYFMSTNTVKIKEKSFATQKVIQMMEELRSLSSGLERDQINVLDGYDEGNRYNPLLTTDRNVLNPENPISNNARITNGWKYLRRISIQRNPEETYTRKVYIRVYKANLSNPSQPLEVLAETMSILRTISQEFKPKQAFDLYVLCMENVPGWWSSMSTMKPSFQSIITDLKTRCPQIDIRTHLITRLSYGRDLQYAPYINNLTNTRDAAIPFIYFYPGFTNSNWDMSMSPLGVNQDFYSLENIEGRINFEKTITTREIRDGYPLCDMYNHAVRYPEELRIFDALTTDAISRGLPKPEISLRMLLERMNDTSTAAQAELTNMLLINLNGELLPCPPIRNYSDAAKDPQNYPNVRVVTHPENIQYTSGSNVFLRVYSYVTNPDNWIYDAKLNVPITVYIRNTIIPNANIHVDRIDGNSVDDYQRVNDEATHGVTYIGGGTLITLPNSPLRSGQNLPTSKGIPVANRLYGLEYIPCPIDNNFNKELTSPSNAKNTARWIIELENLPSDEYTIETRIGNDLTTGNKISSGSSYFDLSTFHDPYNLSKTYVWVGQTPPVTEQYQFLGDPRHMPYLDVKTRASDPGYNWYFTSIPNGDYTGFTETLSGWGDDKLEVDVPRFFQIYRQGLLKKHAIWSAMAGSSFYYYGLGGEFGSDQPPLGLSIPFLKQPWNNVAGQDSTHVYVDEIFPDRGMSWPGPSLQILGNLRVAASRDNSWYARYWLGELYSDSENMTSTNTWTVNGNLETGPNKFYRASYDAFIPTFDRRRKSVRTSSKGCVSFINGESALGSGKHFRHGDMGSTPAIPSNSTLYSGSLTSLGTQLSPIFKFPILSSVRAARPFTLNYKADKPAEWAKVAYSNQRTLISFPTINVAGTPVPRIYYNSNYNYTGLWEDANINPFYASGVVRLATAGTDNCHLVISGLSTQGNFGAAAMGKIVIMTVLRAFLDGGLYAPGYNIPQIPYIDLTSPLSTDNLPFNPSSIHITWNFSWQRWDGEKYTEEYPAVYSTPPAIIYNLKYSDDGGNTWHHCSDNSSTEAGRKDLAPYSYTQSTLSYDWNISDPSRFTPGSYVIRIECYREILDLHYSYDQVNISVNR